MLFKFSKNDRYIEKHTNDGYMVIARCKAQMTKRLCFGIRIDTVGGQARIL
jgi:hypothetical protein